MVEKLLRQEKIDNWGQDQDTGALRFYGRGENGSQRFFVDSDSGKAEIMKKNDGVWQGTELIISPGTLYLGESIGLSAAGHHLMSEHGDGGHAHLYAHRKSESITGTKDDVSILKLTDWVVREISHSDESTERSGTSISYSVTPSKRMMAKRGYFKTGSIAATAPVTLRAYEGSDDTGPLIWKWTFPTSKFPANSEIQLDVPGFLEYTAGEQITAYYTSTAPFSFMGDAGGQPWRASDNFTAIEENMLATTEFISGATYNKHEWYVHGATKKIYICNKTGVQTGTFLDNINRWSPITSDRSGVTGILTGGILTRESDTIISWTAGEGQIVDYSDPSAPAITDLVWPAVTSHVAQNIATPGYYGLGYNSAGVVSETPILGVLTSTFKDYIFFGSYLADGSKVVSVSSQPATLGYDAGGSFIDYIFEVMGSANIIGNKYSANGTNLSVDVTEGALFILGANFRTNPKLPNRYVTLADTVPSITHTYNTATGGVAIESTTDFIDPTKWDNLSGTLQTVPADKWTIQRLYRDRNSDTHAAYGQQVFDSQDKAVASINTDSWKEPRELIANVLRGVLVVQQSATALNNTDQARFFEAGSTRESPFLDIGGVSDFAPLAERVQTTGLLEGGLITGNTATQVSWGAGKGIVTDYTDPTAPAIDDVEWDAVTNFTLTNIALDDTTLICYDSTGSIVEILSSAITPLHTRQYINIGAATHRSGTIISTSVTPGNIGYNGIGTIKDFLQFVIGPANIEGNVYGANGANLNLNVVGGASLIPGANFHGDTRIPDIPTLPSGSAITFARIYNEVDPSKNVAFESASTTYVDPSKYDNGSGTLQTATTDYWTIQHIYRGRDGDTFVAYGQSQYATKTLALEALPNMLFNEKNPTPLMLFRACLLVKQSATALNDTDQAEFFERSSFRMHGISGSSSSIPGITSPGGSDKQIQFNDSSSFGGQAGFEFNKTTYVLTVGADGNPHLVSSPTVFTFNNGTVDAIDINGNTFIRSSAGNSTLSLYSDGGSAIQDATRARLNIHNSVTQLFSQTGTSQLSLNGGLAEFLGTIFRFNDGSTNRIEFTSSTSYLRSPDGANYFQLDDTTTGLIRNGRFAFRSMADSTLIRDVGTNSKITLENGMTFTRDGSIDLIKADATDVRLVSPDGGDKFIVANNSITVNDGTRDRIKSDATDVRLVSPNGDKIFIVSNTGVILPDGSIATTQTAGDNSTKLATTAFVTNAVSGEDLWDIVGDALQNKSGPSDFKFNDGSSIRLLVDDSESVLRAPDNIVAVIINDSKITHVTDEFDVVDHEGHCVLEVKNVGAAHSIATCSRAGSSASIGLNDSAGSDKLHLIYNQATDTANLVSNTTNFGLVQTALNGEFHLQSNGGALTFHDGTRDRLKAGTSDTKLVSPDGSVLLTVGNAAIFLDHNGSELSVTETLLQYDLSSIARLLINATASTLKSPNGNNTLVISNTDARINGHFVVDNGQVFCELSSLSVATTQSAGDNSTKIATTAFVTNAVSVEDLWDLTTGTLQNKTGATEFIFNDGSTNRVIVNSTYSGIDSPDGSWDFTISNSGFVLNEDDNSRILSNDVQSALIAPAGDMFISARDAKSFINDGTRDRVSVNATDSRLVSPDGTVALIVSNTGITAPTPALADNSTKIATTAFVTSHEINGQFTRTGTDLKPTNAGDTLTLDSSLYQPVYGDNTGLALNISFTEVGTDQKQYDKSGHARDASPDLGANPVVSATGGPFGGSVGAFDGSDDFYTCDRPVTGTGDNFTYEAYIYPEASGNGFIINHGATDHDTYLRYYTGKVQFHITFSDESTVTVESGSLSLDNWYRAVGTYDGTTAKLYIDGELVDSEAVTKTTDFDTGFYAFELGGTNFVSTYFEGNIADIKVYERALHQDEIRAHYLRKGLGIIKSDNLKMVGTDNNVHLEITDDVFKYHDGTRDRIDVGTQSIKLYSPDGTSNLEVNNAAVYVTGSIEAFSANAVRFYSVVDFFVQDANRKRIEVGNTDVKLVSPDGSSILTVDNTGIHLTGDQHFTAGSDKIYASDDNGYFQLGTGGDMFWYDVGNTQTRINVTPIGTYLSSPTGITAMQVLDSGFAIDISGNDGTQIDVDPTSTTLASPDGWTTIALANTGATYNGNEIDALGATEHNIFTTAQLTALATAGTITVSGVYKLNIKAAIVSSVKYALETGAALTINICDGCTYTHTGTSDFFAGDGAIRVVGGVLVDSGSGTLFNIQNTSSFQTQQIIGCQVFGWDLGSIDHGVIFIRGGSSIIDARAPLKLSNVLILKALDLGYSRLYSSAIADSVFEIQSGAMNQATTPEILISDFTGKINSTDSLMNIRPSVNGNIRATITSTHVGTAGGTLFNEDGSTGTFTAVADASISAGLITAVSDNGSGIARFASTETVYQYQEIDIDHTHEGYDGFAIISAIGSGWFECSGVPFVTGETAGGFFDSDSVTLTDTGTSLVDGDSIWIDSDGSTDYMDGSYVYNKQTNTFQLNIDWKSATATGTWSTGSLAEDNRYVEVSNSGDSTPSQNFISAWVNDNTTSTSVTGTGTWDKVNFGSIVADEMEGYKLLSDGTFEVTSLHDERRSFTAELTLEKTGNATPYRFRWNKTTGSGQFPAYYPEHEISSDSSPKLVTAPSKMSTGDIFRLEVEQVSGSTNDFLVTHVMVY